MSRIQGGRSVKLIAYLQLEAGLRKSGSVQLFFPRPSWRDQTQIYLLYSYFYGFICSYVGTTATSDTHDSITPSTNVFHKTAYRLGLQFDIQNSEIAYRLQNSSARCGR